MRLPTRFLFFFLLFASFFILFSRNTFAQSSPSSQPAASSQQQVANPLNTNPDVDKSFHNGVQVVMLETISAMICQLTGTDFVNPDNGCLGISSSTHKIGFVKNGKGLIGGMTTLISYTFTPPASSLQYVAYLKNNFGIAKPTYAATTNCPGIGFCAIQPLLQVWVVMRNFSYLIFILIFTIIGVAIMLRVHIDPRTVMTIQNQIPKIIVGLVLVTFSFAISGFLIDVMYTASYLLGSVISSAGVPGQQDYHKVITADNPFDAANKAYNGGVFGIISNGSNDFKTLIDGVFFGPGDQNDPNNPNVFQNRFQVDVIGGIIRSLVGVIIGALAFLIIAIAVIYTLIKLWIILVLAYINILLDIVFAPFWFLLGLVPGSSGGLGGWFKDMLANLAVYPATIAMLILANLFSNLYQHQAAGDELFVPPILGNPLNAGAFTGIIALGFFFMLPNVLQIMKSAFKAPKIDLGPVFQPAGEGAATLKAGVSGAILSKTRISAPGQQVGFTGIFKRKIGGS